MADWYFYDSAGNRRRVSEAYFYDSLGNRREITEGYFYDSAGNRRQFYASNVPELVYNGGVSGVVTGGSIVSWAAPSFGPLTSDRVVVAVITVHDGDPAYINPNVIIGGDGSTQIHRVSPGSRMARAIYARLVPTDGNYSIGFNTFTGTADYYTIDCYSIYGTTVANHVVGRDTVRPFRVTTPSGAANIALAQTWGGSLVTNWAPPFTQDAAWAPQGYATVAQHTGGAADASIDLSDPGGFGADLVVASWLPA